MLAGWTEFWSSTNGLLYAVLALQAITIIWLIFADTRIAKNQLDIAGILRELLNK